MAAPDPTSRYAGLPTISVVAPDGSARVLLGAPRVVPGSAAARRLHVRAGDRLDLLAHIAAGDSTRWWLLADANPYRGRDAPRAARPDDRPARCLTRSCSIELDGERVSAEDLDRARSTSRSRSRCDEADAVTLVAGSSRAPTASGRACSTH